LRRRAARASPLLFGDRLYIELQRHGRPEEKQVEPGLLDLAYVNGIALVATNEPFYGRREDFEAHDALDLHRRGEGGCRIGPAPAFAEHFFKSRAEMTALFADLPKRSPPPWKSPSAARSGPKTRKRSCRASPPKTDPPWMKR